MTLALPWFGPKRGFGWGWTPITWQGWALTLLGIGVLLVAAYAPGVRHRALIFAAVLGGFLAAVAATGKPPGGSWG